MRKILFLLLFGASQFYANSQCNNVLSKNGTIHWKAAQTLSVMAVTIEDYEQLAAEYVKVVETDTDYAPAYMVLGKLYTKIGKEKGEETFDKAEYYFNKCKTACADSAEAVDVELVVLDALRRKHANSPSRFNGLWGRWTKENEFEPHVEIFYTDAGYNFNLKQDINFQVLKKTENSILLYYIFEIKDYRDELRKKRLDSYYEILNNSCIAKPGYQTSGKIDFDRTEYGMMLSYSVINNHVIRNYEGFQMTYWLKGQKTWEGRILLDAESEERFKCAATFQLQKK